MAHNDDERERCPTEGCDNEVVDSDRCAECAVIQDYWRERWERYGRREVANRPTIEDVNDTYSHPCESAKRERMLREIESIMNESTKVYNSPLLDRRRKELWFWIYLWAGIQSTPRGTFQRVLG